MPLIAPFPYYGGKRRAAADIWSRFGNPTVYVEPFFGSGATLLWRDEPCPREIIADTDGYLINFWRSIAVAPDEVAFWADWPTFHHDLTSRHRWLVATQPERSEMMRNDPEFFDAKAAGWWVWGISSWVGSGWCSAKLWESRPFTRDDGGGQGVQAQVKSEVWDQRPSADHKGGGRGVQRQSERQIEEKRPYVRDDAHGRGVQAQRSNLGGPHDQVPQIHDQKGGQGVQAQRVSHHDKIPQMAIKPGGRGVNAQRLNPPERRPLIQPHAGGHGISVQRTNLADKRPLITPNRGGIGIQAQRIGENLEMSGADIIGAGERLLPWFRALAQRLGRVVQLDRDWRSALTPTLLMDTPTSPPAVVAIMLDPPYILGDRNNHIYASDLSGESPAVESYEWALEHGDRYRIAYCSHAGDFEFPDDWTMTSYRMSARKRTVKHEGVYFSPACIDPNESQAEQGVLL